MAIVLDNESTRPVEPNSYDPGVSVVGVLDELHTATASSLIKSSPISPISRARGRRCAKPARSADPD